jgi:hypothetical protein
LTEDAAKAESKAQGRRFWLTVGEVVAVLGLGLAGLNYWDGHRDHQQALRQEAAKAQAQSRSVFVMRGHADKDGERVLLEPTDAAQVVQTQRYLFPAPVLDHGKQISSGRLEIDRVWFEDGLKSALKAARKSGAELPKGEATLPVGVITTYVENGETRTDQSLYQVAYAAEPGLLRTVKLKLLGATLLRRGVKGDVQAAVDAAWRAEAPLASQPAAKSAP